MRTFIRQSQARQLLHNKFVVVLSGSVQCSMYKDLVLLLQRDQYLTLPQLKTKGEFSFEKDSLVERGRLGPMTNGTEYREVRQYRSDHHLLRFYFLTRIYSPYMESILEDFRQGPKPDFIIVSSCVWDITRYGPGCLQQYKENLHKFFRQIKTIVFHDCLILWSLAMPLGKKIKGGFLVPEVSYLSPTLCYNIIEVNFYSSQLAGAYGLDVLDLHFHFRLSLQHRMEDGVHWDALAHRRISSLLLQHAADAWGVNLHVLPFPQGQGYGEHFGQRSMRPEWSRPRPLLESDTAVNIRPLLLPPQPINLHGPTAVCHYGGLPVLQRPLYRQQSSAPEFHRLLPMQHHHHHPPPPDTRKSNLCALPPANLWLGPKVHLQVRGQSAGGAFRFCPHFRAEDGCMRRRRGRPNFRTHPYPCQLPWGTPRHPAYGWRHKGSRQYWIN